MWLYNGCEFTSEQIGTNYGFVYCITNLVSGKKYIGRKYFYSTLRKKPLKGKKRKRTSRTESNWQDYYGSCEDLHKDIELLGKDKFKREILGLYRTKGIVNYHETRLLFTYDVINSREYYNTCIMGRWYGNKI